MKIIKIYSVILTLLLIACTKKKIQSITEIEIPENDSTNTIKDTIVFGNYKNMVVKHYDTLIVGSYGSPRSFGLDFNNNFDDEISVSHVIFGSPGLGVNPRAIISSIYPSVEILGEFRTDTSFKNIRTQLINSNTYTTANYSCSRLDSTDSVISIKPNNFYVLSKEKNTILSKSCVSKSCTSILIGNTFKIFSPIPYFEEFHNNDCQAFELDKAKYIGVKFINGADVKLGWIKLIILSDKNKIFLIESAIQK